MPNIIILPGVETQHWRYFCNHFDIKFDEQEFYDPGQQRYHGFGDLQNYLMIADYNWLSQVWRYSRLEFLSLLANNKILLVMNTDSPVVFRNHWKMLQEIDVYSGASNITCVLECSQFNHKLGQISVEFDLESAFFDLVEQRSTVLIEKNYSKDFLLMMRRPDIIRDLLWETINQDGLTKNSLAVYHKNLLESGEQSNWIGDGSVPLSQQRSLVALRNLYESCCFEIVAETMVDDICWFTEKTARPIAGKTPFLILSVPGTLRVLKNLGFKTFDSLIDESYDQETNAKDRILKICATVSDILKNDPQTFARSSQDIVEHNWHRLAEIKGYYRLKKDQKFLDLLQA